MGSNVGPVPGPVLTPTGSYGQERVGYPPGTVGKSLEARGPGVDMRGVALQSPELTTEVGGLVFLHDERVLSPRPWTEAQSAWARELLEVVPDGPVLELCSGVGHIGLLALL